MNRRVSSPSLWVTARCCLGQYVGYVRCFQGPMFPHKVRRIPGPMFDFGLFMTVCVCVRGRGRLEVGLEFGLGLALTVFDGPWKHRPWEASGSITSWQFNSFLVSPSLSVGTTTVKPTFKRHIPVLLI